MALDGNAALALQVHGVEHLLAHLLARERMRVLEETIRQRRLAVVDVGNDAEVASAFLGKYHVDAITGVISF
jgi:hypothetical protein